MTLEYVNYILWALDQPRNIHTIHTFRLNLEIGVELYSCRDYCSSQEYLQDTMFVPIVFPKLNFNKQTIIEYTNSIDNTLMIQINTIHYSYRHLFLPIF